MTTVSGFKDKHNQERLQMGDFKVGDRVVVNLPDEALFHGKAGKLLRRINNTIWSVLIDGYPNAMSFSGKSLELVTTPTPDVVSHPPHYTDGTPPGIEVIDIIRAHEAAGGTWETLNAVKYILRHTLKDNPVQDIKKAIQYLSMWVERQETA